MISNKEQKLLDTIISKHNFNNNFDQIKNKIDYNQYLTSTPINTLKININSFKLIITCILLLFILVIPITTNGSPILDRNKEIKRIISVDRDNECYVEIGKYIAGNMKLVIGCVNDSNTLVTKNIRVTDINCNIVDVEFILDSDVSILKLSIPNFNINDQISIYFEVYGRSAKKLMSYQITVECYAGSEGVKEYRFLY